MIEVKNISKTYKSKKGKNTLALDNVTLSFSEKGMTFILGKSGSGKSTLLNVLGGLDKYDKGEVLVLGKSTKEFSESEFDSYRNTYVGFIFQEFNLLEEYNVYENITLALQLQQKEINDKELDRLFEKLELSDLKQRKVNELSGGQKQRVAIMRALIKNPKLILADEPTGNLDSKTGKEVMELLQEISKEKLVVIVSHDTEYAKTYGDRIIEIKDGKVISDTLEGTLQEKTKNYETIKSHLPLKESLKLGLGSLKFKKIKLLFTIILIIFTLGFLSCSDTLSSYNYNKELGKTFKEKNEEYFLVENNYLYYDSYGSLDKIPMILTEEKEEKIKKEIKGEPYKVYDFYETTCYGKCSVESTLKIDNKEFTDMYGYTKVIVDDTLSSINEEIIGKNSVSDNEIVISNYIADKIIRNGIYVHELVVDTEFKKSNIFEPKTYEDIINTNYTYYFGELGKVKIVGIINYKIDEKDTNLIENLYSNIYISSSFIENLETYEGSSLNSKYYYNAVYTDNEPLSEYSVNPGALNHEIEYFDGTNWVKRSSLNPNEVILNIDLLTYYDNDYYSNLSSYQNAHYDEDYSVTANRFNANYINEKNVIGKKINLTSYFGYEQDDIFKKYDNLTVVGVFVNDYITYGENTYSESINIYLSEDEVRDIVTNTFENTSLLFKANDKTDLANLSKKFPYESELSIKTAYSDILYNEYELFQVISKIAFYISIVLLVFTIILIMNFMFNSVTYRKKEIGVLRALGSRVNDVSKIFLWEAFVISIISGTVASILLIVVSNTLNSFIKSRLLLVSTPFLIGFRQFFIIYLVVFILTFISSILPIIKISKMKPIDAILNK